MTERTRESITTSTTKHQKHEQFRTTRATGIDITPQKLRQWFCSEMLRLGVSETYVDAFCGRVPKSVLVARHHTDYSTEKLNEIYERANLSML